MHPRDVVYRCSLVGSSYELLMSLRNADYNTMVKDGVTELVFELYLPKAKDRYVY